MDKDLAKRLVAETLQNPFKKEDFFRLAKEICKRFGEEKPFAYYGAYVPEIFRQYVKGYERIGTYTDPEGKKIDVLIVHLQKESSLENARTAQRNFVARYLKDRNEKDAAIVAFVSQDVLDWRFSFVKMEYRLEKTESGKLKAKEEFTPARRYSFLVGAQENSHTAQSRLLPLLLDDKHLPLLSEFEDAFSIEKVTDEFFEKYRNLFLEVRDDLDRIVSKNPKIKHELESKNIESADFAKKLLGQIVFLYFLQKKGWFGVARDSDWGSGPKNFLRKLFNKEVVNYENFFNDVLEPLFYEALARERDSNFYNQLNCKIPFLNGGLFDPINNYDWVHSDIMLPNEVFANTYKTVEGDIGTGILDIFDRYNFTVKEDEPLEKEVAIDPEMLGKVFERLLDVKDRKSKGAYYTPREIVHYMCQQNLSYYLAARLAGQVSQEDLDVFVKFGESVLEHDSRVEAKGKETESYSYKLPLPIRENAGVIDGILSNIKVCDPAVGSGAFLVGMMSEIVRARKTLSAYLGNKPNRTPYVFKHQAIHNSLYGVDLDPGAVEIAKLRLWLSLVVDEDDIKNIKPLPNLDYKIMQGNGLVEEYEGVKLFDEKFILSTESDKELVKTLTERIYKIQQEYIGLHSVGKLTSIKQAELDDAVRHIKKTIAKIESNKDVKGASLFDEMNEARKKVEELQRLHIEFFDSSQKSRKDEIRKQIYTLEWELIEATLRETNNLAALNRLLRYKQANTKPFFLWKLHFSEVFQQGGFDVVIANPPYLGERKNKNVFREVQVANMRDFYLGRMDYFYFFFHLALNISRQDVGQISFITTNYFITALGAKKLRKDIFSRAVVRELINFNELKIFESAGGQHNIITILSKMESKDAAARTIVVNRVGWASPSLIQEILYGEGEQTEYFSIPQSQLWEGEECYLRISGNVNSDTPIQKVFLKMVSHENAVPLGTICNTLIGLESSMDKVYVVPFSKVKGLVGSKKEINYFKPFFKNSDIERYYVKQQSENSIIYLHEKIKDKITDLSGIYAYLMQYKKELSARKGANLRGAFRRGNWWVLNTPRLDMDFEGEKIVTPYRAKTNKFAMSTGPWYASRDVYFITKKDPDVNLKYILAILNSQLFFSWLYNKGKRKGDLLELYSKPLSEVPIIQVSESEMRPFVELVDKISALSQSEGYIENVAKQRAVREHEAEINRLVYGLYKLSPEEIRTIESCIQNKN